MSNPAQIWLAEGECTHVGMVREDNQDSTTLLPQFSSHMVCDGMGGNEGGALASRMATNSARQFLAEKGIQDSFENDIFVWQGLAKTLLDEANAEIHERARVQTRLRGMGTTAVLFQRCGRTALISHVGDSRCYLLRKGKLFQLTQDHSFNNDRILWGDKVTLEDRLSHRHTISRALGVEKELLSDHIFVTLETQDIILLCSDGLHGMLSSMDIARIIIHSFKEGLKKLPQSNQMSSKDAEPLLNEVCAHACQTLITCANRAGGTDNTTACILFAAEHSDSQFNVSEHISTLVEPIPFQGDALHPWLSTDCFVVERLGAFSKAYGVQTVDKLRDIFLKPDFKALLSYVVTEFEEPIYLRDELTMPTFLKRFGFLREDETNLLKIFQGSYQRPSESNEKFDADAPTQAVRLAHVGGDSITAPQVPLREDRLVSQGWLATTEVIGVAPRQMNNPARPEQMQVEKVIGLGSGEGALNESPSDLNESDGPVFWPKLEVEQKLKMPLPKIQRHNPEQDKWLMRLILICALGVIAVLSIAVLLKLFFLKKSLVLNPLWGHFTAVVSMLKK